MDKNNEHHTTTAKKKVCAPVLWIMNGSWKYEETRLTLEKNSSGANATSKFES